MSQSGSAILCGIHAVGAHSRLSAAAAPQLGHLERRGSPRTPAAAAEMRLRDETPIVSRLPV